MPERPWDILARFARGSEDVLLVAPYTKLDTLTKVIDLIQPNANISLVTRWKPKEISSGVSDIECCPAIKERNGTFRLHPSLHAKYYRFDDKVLVGSANLTALGLGYFQNANLEILCPPFLEFDSTEFEQIVLSNSYEVTDAEYEVWVSLKANTPSPLLPEASEEHPSDFDWWPHTQDPEHLWFVYTGRTSQIASVDEQVLAGYDIGIIGIPPDLPRQAFDTWVTGHLLSSPFINAVLGLKDEEPRAARAKLAESWGMSRVDATRNMETAKAWIATFIRRERG